MTTYRIVVEGELSDRFVATFDEMRLERGVGETSLTGEIVDQAQLQGLIARVADLGLSLLSVSQVAPEARLDAGPDRPSSDAEPGVVRGGIA